MRVEGILRMKKHVICCFLVVSLMLFSAVSVDEEEDLPRIFSPGEIHVVL